MPTMMGRVFFLALCLVMHPFMLLIHANQEGDALIAFKKVLNDPNNILQSWDSGLTNPCTWFHITCDNKRVVRVDLQDGHLSGTLVKELGNLKQLQYLELYNNHLTGSIPAELGSLTELISLDLYNNALTGLVPKTLGKLKKLSFLRLNNNKLGGCFPLSVLDLVGAGTLKVINISRNNGFCLESTKNCQCPK